VGDCFFALSDGVDWKSRLDTGQQANLLAEVKDIILRSYGVVAINSASAVFDPVTRNIKLTYDIQTFFSPSFQATLNQAIGAAGV
jgi:hypothetical protein